MCRHLGYLGPPSTLHDLIYAPPHSLETQSYAPKMMTKGCLLNADGFGAGWYPEAAVPAPSGHVPGDGTAHGKGGRDNDPEPAPVRYRRAQPIWNDVSFAEVARVVRTRCLVAAIRSATLGFPADESCAQPFRADRWLFSHNGRIEGFAALEGRLRERAHDALGNGAGNGAARTSPIGGWAGVPDARAPVDSALLFAMAVGHWRRGAALGDGLAEVVTGTEEIASSRLNLLASDGRSLAATACGDSLFVRRVPGGAVIASEPYDESPDWRRIPDRSIVTADVGAIEIQPL